MKKILFVIFSLAIFTAFTEIAAAQSATATLSGTVVDEQGAVVAGASVKITDATKAFERTITANDVGYFIFSQLPPSGYSVKIGRSGFGGAQLNDLVLNVNDQRVLRVQLKVATATATVDVIADSALIDDSPAVSTIVDRQFVENQPLNGRSFQTLVELAPGVVLTPSSNPVAGQFSVNGQRTGSNYFTVDGVSANFGSTASVTLYESAGGGVPSYSALGTTSSLASVDAVQEFSIQTSTYAPEFGRQPGGQISLITRSGTNNYHGSVFNYLRNDIFDAANYFDNRAGLSKPPLRQNDFGGTFGGPLPFLNFGEGVPPFNSGKDRTFFFFSYEGLRLRQPARVEPNFRVPSLRVRQNATGILRDILNAFPLPTGAELTNPTNGAPTGEAPYAANFTNPSQLNATSVRVDHRVSDKVSMFGRFNYAPSEDKQRARFCAASCVADLTYRTQTATFGSTQILTSNVINDLRVNFSKSRVNQTYYIDSFGGAIVPPQSSLYPSFTTRNNGYFIVEVNGSGSNTISDGFFNENEQKQFNIVNSTSITVGGHAIKFGVDYRRLTPVSDGGSYKRLFLPGSIANLASGGVGDGDIIAPDVMLRPIYNNFSLFAQDTWRVNPRLTLTYGLRYEVNPAPSEKNGNLPLSVLGYDENVNNFVNPLIAPRGTKFYDTTYNNFAPRVGAAYQIFEGTVVRGGFGVFFDLGYNFTGTAFSTGLFPFARRLSPFDITLTSPIFLSQPPPNNPNGPFARLFSYEPDYKLPYTLQYNFAVEQAFGANNTVSLSYVGARGRRLGRVESLRNASPNPFRRIDFVTNGASSDYNALQAQYQRRLTRGFQALVSYTFAKSLDTVSEESFQNLQAPTGRFAPDADRGPSTFDVRHAFNGAISYEIPSLFGEGIGKAIFGGFGLDTIVRGRSATPVNVVSNVNRFNLGTATVLRPDLVAGQPLYVDDVNAPGGRRFNRLAFVIPAASENRQGSFERNVLRGFPAYQLDMSLRRTLGIREAVNLQLRVDAFNVFNRANFANPSGVLSDTANFGRSTRTLGEQLAGLSQLYQIGGPRSFQLSAKLRF